MASSHRGKLITGLDCLRRRLTSLGARLEDRRSELARLLRSMLATSETGHRPAPVCSAGCCSTCARQMMYETGDARIVTVALETLKMRHVLPTLAVIESG